MIDEEVWTLLTRADLGGAEAQLQTLIARGDAGLDQLEELLLGETRDPFLIPRLRRENPDLHFRLIELLGESGNSAFIPLLFDAFQNFSHYCAEFATRKSLIALGYEGDEIPLQSISVMRSDDLVIINDDPKYTGFSQCPRCRFFPCKVNEYFRKGIQDCSLYNEHDPRTLGRIKDYRTSGSHIHADTAFRAEGGTRFVPPAGGYSSAEDACRDIPLLCARISGTRKLADPVGWYYLHRCFSYLGEKEGAQIMLREAARWARLVPSAAAEVRAGIDDFARQRSLLEPSSWKNLPDYRMIELEREGRWVEAWRHYARVNLLRGEKTASSWYFIAESHFALSELALAELFVRGSILLSCEGHQRGMFEDRANEMKGSSSMDVGLNLAARREG